MGRLVVKKGFCTWGVEAVYRSSAAILEWLAKHPRCCLFIQQDAVASANIGKGFIIACEKLRHWLVWPGCGVDQRAREAKPASSMDRASGWSIGHLLQWAISRRHTASGDSPEAWMMLSSTTMTLHLVVHT